MLNCKEPFQKCRCFADYGEEMGFGLKKERERERKRGGEEGRKEGNHLHGNKVSQEAARGTTRSTHASAGAVARKAVSRSPFFEEPR